MLKGISGASATHRAVKSLERAGWFESKRRYRHTETYDGRPGTQAYTEAQIVKE